MSINLPQLLGGASQTLNPITLGTSVLGDVLSIFGGGKPDLRPQREDEMYAMVANAEPYALEAAREIWWRHSNAGSKADGAENTVVWQKIQSQFPQLAAQAMALGPLTDDAQGSPHIPRSGQYIAQRPDPARMAAQANLANTVNNVGSGLTNAATNAIYPQGGNVALPTSIGTIVMVGVIVLLLFLLMRGRR